MTHQHTKFTDADIHAYVDGQLDATRTKGLEKCLKTDSQLAKKVEDYQLINTKLQNILNPVVHEPVPEILLKAGSPTLQKKTSQQSWLSMAQAAALAALMLVSGLTGWTLRGDDIQETLAHLQTDLVQPATFAHSIYANDPLHPVEITAENEEQLISWLSQRLKTDIKAPNLNTEGFHLLGGRLIPSTNRMAAQFMYQNNEGERVSLYVRRGAWDKKDIPLHYNEDNGLAAFTWVDNSMGYALSGNLQRMNLLALAETAHSYK